MTRRLFPGSPSVWKVAALLGALIAGLIAYELAIAGRELEWAGCRLLLAPLVAALGYAAVRLIAQAAAGTRGRLPTAVAIAAIAFGHAAAWSLITPPFEGPDEPDHYAYVEYLAQTGNAPCQGCDKPRYSSEQRLAMRGVAAGARRDDGGGTTTAASHPPAYYALMTAAYATGGSAFDRLHAIRLLSALLGAATAALAFLVVRELVPGRPLPAALAGVLVALQPMFANVSGAVNNDNGVNAMLALVACLLVRALRRGLTPLVAAGIGAALVLAPLTKLTGYAALAPALVALGFLAARRPTRADLPAWLTLAGAVAALWLLWWGLAGGLDRTVYTTPDGGSLESQPVLRNFASDPLGYLSYLARAPFYETYVERGFAAFGARLDVRFPGWVYVAVAIAMVATSVLAVRTVALHSAAARARVAELATLAALAVAVVLGVHMAFFGLPAEARAMGEQGRYAFTAMTAWAAVAAAGSLGLGVRQAPAVAAVMVSAMIALGVGSMLLALERFYA